MAKKISNFTDLVQRVTASCLLHPLGSTRFHQIQMTPDHRSTHPTISEELLKSSKDDDDGHEDDPDYSTTTDSEDDEPETYSDARETEHYKSSCENEVSMSALMAQVFDSVSALKKAYVKLQGAHSPWDPAKMQAADTAVVAELRRMAVLRERFRRGGRSRKLSGVVPETVREVVAPYEAVVEELKKEVRVREGEAEELRDKVKCLSSVVENGKKANGRVSGSRKKTALILSQFPTSPSPEIFESTMSQVREASKSFTSHLLSLMRTAKWDISSAVRSIETAISTVGSTSTIPHHQHNSKYALESYALRKVFTGFEHETFYMDGTLSSLLNPSQFRHECFSKFKDMKSMDPSELLGILPTCPFGVFCSKKYQDIIHPKMEESLFGNLDQRNCLLNGSHPRTRFYTLFLGLAKAVWLLHLLAFSLDPPPSHFEASRGAEFHPDYMESVVRFPGGKVPSGQVVGFPVSPGFKLGNGYVLKARVYLVHRN